MTLTTTTNHLSVWAVMVSSSTSAASTKTPLPAVLSVVALAATAIIVGRTIRLRK